jgi:capsid protein
MNVSWTTPRRVTVDAGRDAMQNRLDIETGIKSLTDNYLEEGLDPKEKMRENAAEKRFLLDLSKEFDIPLSLIYKPQNVAPDAINASVGEKPDKEDGTKPMPDDGEELPDDPEESNPQE